MPSQGSVTAQSLEHSYRLTLCCDLEFDITDERTSFEAPVKDFPWVGKWTVGVLRDSDGLVLNFKHGLKVEGLFGREVGVALRFEWQTANGAFERISQELCEPVPLPERNSDGKGVYCGVHWNFVQADWEKAAVASGGAYNPKKQRLYRVVFTFEQSQPKAEELAVTPHMLARRVAGLNLEQLPHNVRLFFPRAHKYGAELWVKADTLSRSSAYLKDLLASDFAEAQPRRSKRARTSGAVEATPTELQDEKDFEDSDDETDKFLFSKKPPSLSSSSSEADDISFRQITITQTAFSTYHAVLVYLHTGFIDFAPLSSSFPLAAPAVVSRGDFLASKYDEDPSLPLPVSPLSAYRLAHLLQLEDLQKRCLDSLASSLTVAGAARELFSDFSSLYEDARKVIIEFVVKHRKEVEASPAYKDIGARLKARDPEMAHAGAILFELLEAERAAAEADAGSTVK